MFTPSAPHPFPGILLQDANSIWETEQRPLLEVRGVAFGSTAVTEQFALTRLRAMHDRLGIRLGNRPLGAWRYGALPGDPAPLVVKFVSVSETLGDRRLDRHLFAGLEQLVCRSVRQADAAAFVAVAGALYGDRGLPGSSLENSAWAKVGAVLVDDFWPSLEARQQDPAAIEIPGLGEEDLARQGLLPTQLLLGKMDGRLREVARLYARIGWEVGRVLAALHRSGFLWGTFMDHSRAEPHCNAHTNNMIVLMENVGEVLVTNIS
jgi:hypothetical protein